MSVFWTILFCIGVLVAVFDTWLGQNDKSISDKQEGFGSTSERR